MIRVFIGYDENESVAYHVLSHSILRHASQPVSITPLVKQVEGPSARTSPASTRLPASTITRWLMAVPWLLRSNLRRL